MSKDNWEEYRNMSAEELQEAVNNGYFDAAEYVYHEYDGDDVNPLATAILREQGYTEEDICRPCSVYVFLTSQISTSLIYPHKAG